MAINELQKTHFFLLPFMAPGHMTPMVDIARLLANRGVTITILTTPHNASRFNTVISRAIDSGLNIHIINLKFPFLEVGLPEGCENFDMIPAMDDAFKFFKAITLLQDQVQEILQKLKPSCLISDTCFPWTTNACLKLSIPRIVFDGMSCFSLLCMHMLNISKDFDNISSDTEYFVIPGLPDRIEITKAQLRGTVAKMGADWTKIRDDMRESEVKAFGTVVNTFEELEFEYIKKYSKVKGKKVWCIGPVSLCNKFSIDEHHCLKWLESREPNSVLYVCLRSLSRLATTQLIELGWGLEASNRPFIWVIRDASDGFVKWLLEENYEERIKNRGLLIHGWEPQVLILSYPSVGGFLKHYGWNSSLEGVTAGIPMLTWPIFADQFCNEKFIVNVVKTGIKVGVELPVIFGDEEKVGVLVKSDGIKVGIEELMNGGEDGEERRERARKLAEKAERATEECGSSSLNLRLLIQDVSMWKANAIEHEENGVTLVHKTSDELIVQ